MKTRIVPIFVFLLLCIIFIWTWLADRSNDRAAHRKELTAVSQQVAIRLEEFFHLRLKVLVQLKEQYLQHGDQDPAIFRRLSLDLQERFQGFQAVSFVDANGVVRIPVPLQGNEAVLNRDLKDHPLAGEVVRRTIAELKPHHTGPLSLIQGQMGFACYLPMVKDGQLLGIINGVFRFQPVMDECLTRGAGAVHSFQLRHGDTVVASFGDQYQRNAREAGKISPLEIGGTKFSLEVFHNEDQIGELGNGVDFIILFLGVGLALALAVLVSHLYRSRELLRRSEERTERILSSAQEGIWAVNQEGIVVFANQQIADMLGINIDRIVGRHFTSFSFESDHDFVKSNFVERKQGISGSFDLRLKSGDGMDVWAHVVETPAFNAAGEFTGALAMVSDEREKKNLQEQLWQSQKMDALGRLAGGIAHDFNNILTAILGASELISADGPVNESQGELISEIQAGSQRAARMISQLLTFSRNDVVAMGTVDICQVIKSMTPMLERLMGDDIQINFELPENIPKITADATQIEQVVLNLAINSKDAMGMAGRLGIKVAHDLKSEKKSEAVVLEVSDSGPGISSDLIDLVFEPFFTTKEIGQGTGLGLATVHGILMAADAEIEVLSPPQEGARFLIRFPVGGLT